VTAATVRTLLLGAILGLVVGFALCLAQDHDERPAPVRQTVQEDDPGWDCRTMGNRRCGDVQRV